MKNFKRLVAGALAATMALALSVSAFAEVEVTNAVNASYADGKAAYEAEIDAKNGTQMTVAIFKEEVQNENISASNLEYINQDEEGVLNLSAMGTKNNLLAEDNEGNAIYAGTYVIRVGYYDEEGNWKGADEGTFTIATKAAASTPDTISIVWGDINADGVADPVDVTNMLNASLGGNKLFTDTTSGNTKGYQFTWNVNSFIDANGNECTFKDTWVWGDINADGVADPVDVTNALNASLGGNKLFKDYTWNVSTELEYK